MALNFSKAPKVYDESHQDQVQSLLEREDKKNLKSGQILDKLLFRDTADGTIKTVVVTSGAFVIT